MVDIVKTLKLTFLGLHMSYSYIDSDHTITNHYTPTLEWSYGYKGFMLGCYILSHQVTLLFYSPFYILSYPLTEFGHNYVVLTIDLHPYVTLMIKY